MQPANAQLSSVRLSDSVCATCHAEILRRQVGTRMANAGGPAREGVELGTRSRTPPS